MEYESPKISPLGPDGNVSYGTSCSMVFFCVAAVYLAVAVDVALAVNGVALMNAAVAVAVTQYVTVYNC